MRNIGFITNICSPSYYTSSGLISSALEEIDLLFPEYDLNFTLTTTKFEKIPNREKWLMKKLNKKDNIYICNNSFEKHIRLSGQLMNAINRLNSHEYSLTNIELPINTDTIGKIDVFAGEIGDSMQAFYHSVGSPGYEGPIINSQILFQGKKVENIPHALPPLASFMQLDVLDYDFPPYVSWVNYWSREIAEKVGFDFERDRNKFYSCFQTPRGAFVLRITKDPLDIANESHFQKLKFVYDHFPKIGRQDLL